MSKQVSVRYLMALAWPAILEQLLLTMATYVDTAMIGALGYRATAAVAVNSSTAWLIMGILTALGVGYSVQVTHGLGAKDFDWARRASHQALVGALALGGLLMVCFALLSRHVPVWLGADEEILADAQAYLFCYAMGLPFYALLNVFSAVLRCSGDTKTPLYVNTGANFINVVLNFLLIFPEREVVLAGRTFRIWGAGLKVAGAAIATSASYVVASLVLMAVMLNRASPTRLSVGGPYRPERSILLRAMRLGFPVALERVAISSGQLIMTRFVTSLGNVALSANHVAVTAEAMSYLPANGISFAATTVVGQEVGAGEEERARRYGDLAGWLGLLAGVLGGLLLFLPAVPLARLFSRDEEVVLLAAAMLRIVAVSEPMFSLSIVLSGVLRGAGNTQAAFISVLVGMWGVRIAAATFLLYWARMELSGVWLAMAADLVVRGIICMVWVKRLDWAQMCRRAVKT